MIALSIHRLCFLLVLVVGALALLNGLLGFRQYLTGSDAGLLYDVFDVNNEANVPTWFSTILLLGPALVTAFIATLKQRDGDAYWRDWWGVSAVFGYLSLDEAALLHERWGSGYEDTGPGLLWLAPELWVTAIAALVFARFFAQLPPTTRLHLLLAASCYLGGALVLDKAAAYLSGTLGTGVVTGLLAIAEETLEQIGAVLFLYTFLRYLRRWAPDFRLSVSD